jgi:PAS domain S-box-containing protein
MRHKTADIRSSYERAERLADLLWLSYEPMLAWHLDGPIEFWNAGAEQLYGYTADEAIGPSSHALLQTKLAISIEDLRAHLARDAYWSGELRRAFQRKQPKQDSSW